MPNSIWDFFIIKVMAWPKIIDALWAGFARRRNRDMREPNSLLGLVFWKVKEFPEMPGKRSNGFAKLLNRGMHPRSTIWHYCIITAKA